MLNWRIEEEDCVKKAIEKYFEEENKNPFSFLMIDKTRRKNIQYVTDRARERYRQEKLERYEEEIKNLKEKNQHIFANVNDDELLRSNAMNWAEKNELQDRINKAIEFIKDNASYVEDINRCVDDLRDDNCDELLKILKGEK